MNLGLSNQGLPEECSIKWSTSKHQEVEERKEMETLRNMETNLKCHVPRRLGPSASSPSSRVVVVPFLAFPLLPSQPPQLQMSIAMLRNFVLSPRIPNHDSNCHSTSDNLEYLNTVPYRVAHQHERFQLLSARIHEASLALYEHLQIKHYALPTVL